MTTETVGALMRNHYPGALPASAFRRKMIGWLENELGMDMAHILLATSVCADDVVFITDVAGNIETHRATQEMFGLFEMGGLAGLPFTGKTGMTAFAHHVPDHGAACIVYGPHIGMTDGGQLGRLLRPGQHEETTACGALGVAINHFQSHPDYQPVLDEDDSQEALLELRLKPYIASILAAPNALQAATEVVYRITHELILRYVAAVKLQFRCERVALIGAVIINTSPAHEDYVDLRHSAVLRLADL
jgi:hypothetical protein